jgi:EAL domain-containing protein (putative c-di-GMP-specific phosphodiesterase class I)
LKIDGSLIKNIKDNELSKNIVETIVLFAKKQKIKTVAEFVESEDIYNIVKEMGIDYSQGYAFGKPQELD